MNWHWHDSCPLCGESHIVRFRRARGFPEKLDSRDFRITDNRYGQHWQLYSCRRCGFAFANPFLSQDDLIQFYADLQDPEYGEEKENRSRNFQTILHRLESLHPYDRSILDVGAASGIFLDMARRFGYSIQGVEPSRFLTGEAKRIYGIDLFRGTLEQFPVEKRFGVITLLDILEHAADPDGLIAQSVLRLADGGFLVIVTPDIGSFAAQVTGGRWWHFRLAHVQFFRKKTLFRLLQKHGMRIIKTRRYAWNFSLYYLLSRFFPILIKKKSLQTRLKKLHLKLQLFDSLEVYAQKRSD